MITPINLPEDRDRALLGARDSFVGLCTDCAGGTNVSVPKGALVWCLGGGGGGCKYT